MNSRTVLVIDNDSENIASLTEILKDNFALLSVESIVKGMEFLSANPNMVRAIIIAAEVKEPDSKLDCTKFLKKIQNDKVLSRIPVIVTSREMSHKLEVKAMENGAIDFISQPYSPEIINYRVRNVIHMNEATLVASNLSRNELTGLYTKPFFLMKAEEILENDNPKKYDFICIDIEHFKLVNDALGTEVSNRILCHVAKVLKETVSARGGIVGHFSEDIFFVLMQRPEEYTNESVGGWFDKVNDFPGHKGKNIKLKLCCGIYKIHNMRVPLSVMCDRAQMATEKIKGRYDVSFCHYDDSIRSQLMNDQRLTDTMEASLAANEFEVFYQPKYELSSEAVAGAEALVRWNHPELGFLNPGSFIPLFERNGFITQIDMFVWETVCRDLHEWIEAGNEPVPVSVNVSRADIYNPNLVQILVSLIKKYKISPKYLHLEITESAYTEAPEQIIKVVRQLRNYNFLIEMDDFGTGYSSLNMLSEMPIDILKLDMGFVRNGMEKNSSKGILNFVIKLAKWLNLSVIAEGVETSTQVLSLKDMECNFVQGFYFAHPQNKKDFFNLLKNGPVFTPSGALKNLTEAKHEQTMPDEMRGGTMLIVDDTESSREILRAMFKQEYDIMTCENGQEAWDYLTENANKISIVLLDLVMPVMDGFKFLSNMRSDNRTSMIPVIVTSQGDQQSELRALSLDADDFVCKPYNAEILRHRVRNVVAHSKVVKLEQERILTQKLLETERQVHTDYLTGLSNRIILEKKMAEFFTTSEIHDAVFIGLDVDDFKTINDTLGHTIGDETIKRVAKILSEFFTENETVCRMGGDEFAIFIPRKIGKDMLEAMLHKLCSKLNFTVDTLSVSCSIGVAVSPLFGMDYQTLYANADLALLAAKRYGKNQFIVYNGQSVLPSYVFYRNMDWLLDEFNDAVYVCYEDSYDLFYINKTACRIAGKEKKNCIGQKCYKVLWGRDEPCEFCIKGSRSYQKFVSKEITPSENSGTFTMRSKIVNWSGVDARIQYLTKK